MNVKKHLIFYDGDCGFCGLIVDWVVKKDKKNIFVFAPLQGKTAAVFFKKLPKKTQNQDTLFLFENYKENRVKVLILGKGALRILWLLGGMFRLFGWLSFLPGFLYNWLYRLIAVNRSALLCQNRTSLLKNIDQDKFLP